MNNLTQQQMLELACKVYPEKLGWEIAPGLGCPRRVTSMNINDAIMCIEHFNPSLTGGDWQVKQAVDVLNKLAQGITSLSDPRAHLIIFAIRDKVITPSAKALLADRGKG